MKEKRKNKAIKQLRIFSEEVKKQVVKDIENGRCSVTQASQELLVSDQSIYNWIYRYSCYLKKNKVLVVEDNSEMYRSKELEKRLIETESALGRKQIENDFLNKIIELANEEYHTDLKKNLRNRLLNGSGLTKDSSTGTK